jgi:hypothetical protein
VPATVMSVRAAPVASREFATLLAQGGAAGGAVRSCAAVDGGPAWMDVVERDGEAGAVV